MRGERATEKRLKGLCHADGADDVGGCDLAHGVPRNGVLAEDACVVH